ncbi:MAG: hypothetical protein J3K34DRAFT_423769 [Monoraphidium minutum]|nr:MAG: hypothetical protein J3K34DRAFT_423769 [Monoraphidium minutum]
MKVRASIPESAPLATAQRACGGGGALGLCGRGACWAAQVCGTAALARRNASARNEPEEGAGQAGRAGEGPRPRGGARPRGWGGGPAAVGASGDRREMREPTRGGGFPRSSSNPLQQARLGAGAAAVASGHHRVWSMKKQCNVTNKSVCRGFHQSALQNASMPGPNTRQFTGALLWGGKW